VGLALHNRDRIANRNSDQSDHDDQSLNK
jgi:hypothetical protein